MDVLFKKIHKANDFSDDREKELTVKEKINDGEELENRLQKEIKKMKRIQQLKGFLYYCLILIVVIGSIKGLLISTKESPYALAINDYSFVDSYISNYFQFPQDESTNAYLNSNALDGNWKADYGLGEVQSAKVTNTDIYRVEQSDEAFNYYAHINLKVDTKEKSQDLGANVKLKVIRNGESYLVIAPITMNYTDSQSMSDELKKTYAVDHALEGTECDDSKKEELKTTIQLFLTTYASDYTQARLLMNNPSELDPLDATTTIKIENFGSIRENNDEYIVDVSVLVSSSDLIQQRQTIRFRIDQATNKILDMEEY